MEASTIIVKQFLAPKSSGAAAEEGRKGLNDNTHQQQQYYNTRLAAEAWNIS